MKQPLHFSQTNGDLVGWLKARAALAFFMTQLSAAVGRKSHPFNRTSLPGFRSSRQNDHRDVTFLEDRMIQAGMMKAPIFVPGPRRQKREAAAASFRERYLADQASGLSRLTNYEMGKYQYALRHARKTGLRAPDPKDFIGCRGHVSFA